MGGWRCAETILAGLLQDRRLMQLEKDLGATATRTLTSTCTPLCISPLLHQEQNQLLALTNSSVPPCAV
jgi:hypothetical protein